MAKLDIDGIDFSDSDDDGKNTLAADGKNTLANGKNILAEEPKYTIARILDMVKKIVTVQISDINLVVDIMEIKNYKSMLFVKIKDDSDAMMDAIIYRSNYKYPLAANDKISINCRLDLYNSKLQLNIRSYTKVGINNQVTALQLLKAKLAKMGYFDKKILLEDNYTKIGIISSLNAAGMRDFVHTINSRCVGKKLYIYPATMQGKNAPNEIVNAIELAVSHHLVQILVIVRGGGASEDLECFNDELVAHAIYSSKIPIVTGIGHQINTTVADLVCAKSFITPTAVAQNITLENNNGLELAVNLVSSINHKIISYLDSFYEYLTKKEATVAKHYETWTSEMDAYLDKIKDDLQLHSAGYNQSIENYANQIKILSRPRIIDSSSTEIILLKDLAKNQSYTIQFIDGSHAFKLT